MSNCPVELSVGGHTYRVVSTAAPDELQRLAQIIEERLRTLVPPGRQTPPNALVLVALSLAHELEQERARRVQLERRAGQVLKSVLERIDGVLEQSDDAEPAASPATVSRTVVPAQNRMETSDN